MADDTAALVVALSAQLSTFEKNMKDAVKIADTQTKAIETRFSKMNDEINSQFKGLASVGAGQLGPLGGFLTRLGPVGLVVAAGIGAAAVAFGDLAHQVDEYVKQADRLRNASDTTGVTITQLDELSKIGLTVGVGMDQTEQAVGKMTVAFDQLKEATGPLYEVLKKTPEALAKISAARDSGAAIDELAAHFASLGSEFEKNAFLRAAFGRGGLPFGRVLQAIADAGGLTAIEEQAKKAGKAINEETVKAVDDLDDRLKLLKKDAADTWGETFGVLVLSIQERFFKTNLRVAQAVKEVADRFDEAASHAVEFYSKVQEESEKASNRDLLPGLPALVNQPRGQTGTTAGPAPVVGPNRNVAVPDILAQLTGENVPLPSPKPTALTETLDQRIKKLRDYISALGDTVAMHKRLELSEAQVDKAVKESGGAITDEEARRKKTVDAIDLMIEAQQKEIAAKGAGATATDQAALVELRLQRAKAAGTLTSQAITESAKAENVQRQIAIITAREAAGVASETEIAQKGLLQVQQQLYQQGLKGIDLTKQTTIEEIKAKEATEARDVSASRLPQTLRAAQEAMSGFKNADQLFTSLASNFEGAMGDIANGSKTAAQAFKSLADSIIRDLVRIAIRMTVTGPLLKGISGLFGEGGGGFNFLFGGGSPSGFGANRQGGGPVSKNVAYTVGEHGRELFVPGQSGMIVPNLHEARQAGQTSVVINNFTAADSETRQSRQSDGPNAERIVIDIVKKAQARGDLDDASRGRFGLRPAKVR